MMNEMTETMVCSTRLLDNIIHTNSVPDIICERLVQVLDMNIL